MSKVSEAENKNQRLQSLLAEKTKKDVDLIKKQLKHERTMKLDAFQRVDDLQTAMYDIGELSWFVDICKLGIVSCSQY